MQCNNNPLVVSVSMLHFRSSLSHTFPASFSCSIRALRVLLPPACNRSGTDAEGGRVGLRVGDPVATVQPVAVVGGTGQGVAQNVARTGEDASSYDKETVTNQGDTST